jgi:hypothetical protein
MAYPPPAGGGPRPVATRTPKLKEYLTYWLDQVVRTSLKPKTAKTYATHVRLYINPGLGEKRLDKLTVRDVRGWPNRLGEDCQCCAQGKDVTRPPELQRCCTIGKCWWTASVPPPDCDRRACGAPFGAE